MSNKLENDPFHQGTSFLNTRRRKKKSENYEDVGFMNQKVNLVNSILFPNGYENLMLAVYFVIVPYVAGLLFIFFYIAKGDYTVLLTLNDDNSFLITWAIGYEVVAALLLLWITKLALFSYLRSKSGNNHRNNFRIP